MVAGLWGWVDELVKVACDSSQGELQPANIKSRALSGELSIWAASLPANNAAPLAIAIIRLEKWSDEIVCRIVALAGPNMMAWRNLLPEFEDRLREMNVSRIRFEGRRGWQNVLPDYRLMRIVMEKSI